MANEPLLDLQSAHAERQHINFTTASGETMKFELYNRAELTIQQITFFEEWGRTAEELMGGTESPAGMLELDERLNQFLRHCLTPIPSDQVLTELNPYQKLQVMQVFMVSSLGAKMSPEEQTEQAAAMNELQKVFSPTGESS